MIFTLPWIDFTPTLISKLLLQRIKNKWTTIVSIVLLRVGAMHYIPYYGNKRNSTKNFLQKTNCYVRHWWIQLNVSLDMSSHYDKTYKFRLIWDNVTVVCKYLQKMGIFELYKTNVWWTYSSHVLSRSLTLSW